MSDYKTYDQLLLDYEILQFEAAQLIQALEQATFDKAALKEIAVRHYAALEEANTEIGSLRELVKNLMADVAHYMRMADA